MPTPLGNHQTTDRLNVDGRKTFAIYCGCVGVAAATTRLRFHMDALSVCMMPEQSFFGQEINIYVDPGHSKQPTSLARRLV